MERRGCNVLSGWRLSLSEDEQYRQLHICIETSGKSAVLELFDELDYLREEVARLKRKVEHLYQDSAVIAEQARRIRNERDELAARIANALT